MPLNSVLMSLNEVLFAAGMILLRQQLRLDNSKGRALPHSPALATTGLTSLMQIIILPLLLSKKVSLLTMRQKQKLVGWSPQEGLCEQVRSRGFPKKLLEDLTQQPWL